MGPEKMFSKTKIYFILHYKTIQFSHSYLAISECSIERTGEVTVRSLDTIVFQY